MHSHAHTVLVRNLSNEKSNLLYARTNWLFSPCVPMDQMGNGQRKERRPFIFLESCRMRWIISWVPAKKLFYSWYLFCRNSWKCMTHSEIHCEDDNCRLFFFLKCLFCVWALFSQSRYSWTKMKSRYSRISGFQQRSYSQISCWFQ
jgi:hypothetical protein